MEKKIHIVSEVPAVDRHWQAARRVLVVRLDNLGDVLLATPAIRALRQALPRAHLTLFASPGGGQAVPLNPDLDDAIVYRAPWMDPDHVLPLDPSREASAIAAVRQRGYDGAIIFTSYHQSALPPAYLCYQAGIPLRHAASIDGPGSLLTTRHQHPDRSLHEVERGLDLVGGLGIHQAGADDLVLEPRECDQTALSEALRPLRSSGRPIVALHPGCSCPSRTYPSELFVEAARALQDQLGVCLVWTGAPDEVDLVRSIQSALADPGLSLAGKTDLSQLAALFRACDVVVTNNTGPMHVAAAVHTPVVALFALTNPPEQWHPWKVPHRLLNHPVPCALCYRRVCPYQQECLRLVSADDIVSAVAELLEERHT